MKKNIGASSLISSVSGLIIIQAGFSLHLLQGWGWRVLLAGFTAGTVGGIADWFAVRALFYRIPLPFIARHTNVLANNRERLTEAMVDLITTKWLSPEILKIKIINFSASKAIVVLLKQGPTDLSKVLEPLFADLDLAKPLGTWLQQLIADGKHQELLQLLYELLLTVIEHPNTKAQLEQLIEQRTEEYKQENLFKRVLATFVDQGSIVEKLLSTARDFVTDAKDNKQHLINQEIERQFIRLANRLCYGPPFREFKPLLFGFLDTIDLRKIAIVLQANKTLSSSIDTYVQKAMLLGNAYLDNLGGNRHTNIDLGIASFSAALTVIVKNQYPQRWAMLQNNLGLAYLARQNGEQNLLGAVKSFKSALQIRTREQLPVEFIRSSRALGETYYHLQNWREAHTQFRRALDTADDLRHRATNVVSHLYLSQDMADTFRMAIHTALLLGNTQEAALLNIAGKARTLAERVNAIAITDAQLQLAGPELDRRLKEVQVAENSFHWCEGTDQDRDRLRARHKELLDRLAVDHPAMAPIRYFEALSETELWQQIAAIGNIPVLDYSRHAGGCGVFVYVAGHIRYIELDNNLFELIENVTNQIKKQKNKNKLHFFQRADHLQQLRRCYDLIFAPVRSHLPEVGQLLISPYGSLHQLPFQALPDDQNNFLSASYAMNFLYSISMLPILNNNRADVHGARPGRLLNIAYADAKKDPAYPLVEAEMSAVAACFTEVVTLADDKATPTAAIVQASAEEWDVIHINSHGSFVANDPSRTGLYLQSLLTIQDILLQMKLKGSPLVTLSACQSGHLQIQEGEETSGLVSAFLSVGAGAIISSLWEVPVGSTKVLMEYFYTLRRDSDQSDAQLLQIAMAEVRAMTPYKNPDFWAAFQITGLPSH